MTGNKKKEIEKRSAHLDGLKAAKARRSVEPILERAAPSINKKQTLLIVCEGKNEDLELPTQTRHLNIG
jgi:hypothetical protein